MIVIIIIKKFKKLTIKKELSMMRKLFQCTREKKSTRILNKKSHLVSGVIAFGITTAFITITANDANAAGTAAELPFLDDLHETIKSLMTGPGSLIIDAMILAGGGWAAARTSTPAPVFYAVASVFVFEMCTKLILRTG